MPGEQMRVHQCSVVAFELPHGFAALLLFKKGPVLLRVLLALLRAAVGRGGHFGQ